MFVRIPSIIIHFYRLISSRIPSLYVQFLFLDKSQCDVSLENVSETFSTAFIYKAHDLNCVCRSDVSRQSHEHFGFSGNARRVG